MRVVFLDSQFRNPYQDPKWKYVRTHEKEKYWVTTLDVSHITTLYVSDITTLDVSDATTLDVSDATNQQNMKLFVHVFCSCKCTEFPDFWFRQFIHPASEKLA
jgi:hypothetical protein